MTIEWKRESIGGIDMPVRYVWQDDMTCCERVVFTHERLEAEGIDPASIPYQMQDAEKPATKPKKSRKKAS